MRDTLAVAIVSTRVIGWRERLSLPELGLEGVVAKMDTGARTSALNATGIVVHHSAVEDQLDVVSFDVRDSSRPARLLRVRSPIHDVRRVKSSNGQVEERIVIRTAIVLGGRRFTIEMTLTDRSDMGFPILIGRQALRRRFLVDAGRSFLVDPQHDEGGHR